ncbi:MAG: carboxypeptidase regulatory-like domain-containing protein [Planctomycetes bacterium]|nr:carboxypeptidase regulatory-like domain-containing protein [Planctomycetota bacterium]
MRRASFLCFLLSFLVAAGVVRAHDALVPAPVKVEVKGVCVAAEDQTPLAGCVVRVMSLPLSADPALPETELLRAQADASGNFSVQVDLPFGFFEARFEIDGRCQVGRALSPKPPAPGEEAKVLVIDLGNVDLPIGREVRGVVLDVSGAPVAGAAIRVPAVKGIAPHREQHGAPGLTLRAVADAQGQFRFERRFPPGNYQILWELPQERELRSPLRFDVKLEIPATELEIRTSMLPIITGRIVLPGVAKDQPLPIQGLEVVGTSGKQIYRTKVDALGRFSFRARVQDKGPVLLDIPAGAIEAYRHPAAVAWGTQDVELVIQSAGGVEVVVVEAGTGAPIELFAALCIPMDGDRPMRDIVWPEAATHPGGKAKVNEVPAGDCMLHVWAKAPEYATAKQVRFTRKAGETPVLRVEFERKK